MDLIDILKHGDFVHFNKGADAEVGIVTEVAPHDDLNFYVVVLKLFPRGSYRAIPVHWIEGLYRDGELLWLR